MKAIKENIKNVLDIEYADESNVLRHLKKIKHCLNGGWYTPFEVKRRTKIDIFDYKALAKPLSFYPYVPIEENNLYGNGCVISKRFSDIDLRVTTIEHGLYIGSLVPERHLLKFYENIITFSEYRKKYIENKTDKNIITIGPYIKYTDSLYTNKEINSKKTLLGKTLVVFPSHSIDSIYAKYNIERFIKYIDSFKDEFNFDKIIICLYWKDIALNMDKQYINAGFSIVTAGHIYDAYFLSRLKTILLLADAILTNAVGTHVGYAVTLDIPVKIWSEDKVSYSSISGNETEAEKELSMRKGFDLDSQLQAADHIKNVFSSFNGMVSNEQKNCVQYYWGV